MPVDPAIQQILDGLAATTPTALEDMSPAELRSVMEQMAAIFPGPEVETEDRTIPGPRGDLPVRIYRPEGDGPFPVAVFFHGGGFVIGSIASHDATCRSLCQRAGAVFVSVEYRLAPEHPFPAAPEDCYAATRWVFEHGAELGVEPSRLAVIGDSAGGNLAAVVCLMAKERGGPPIAFQALVYPVTDHVDTVSRSENAEGYLLTTAAMDWFIDHYADEEARTSPWCAPLRAVDLVGLPPALVVTAEYDPLRDEGEAYGRRLQEAGVPVTISRYDGVVHGFFSMTAIVPRAVDAEDEVAQALRRMLA
jgi:acetyl esterase